MPTQTLIVLFVIRILALLASCYVNVYVLPVSDSLAFHKMGIEEFDLLLTNPHQYFVNFVHNPYVHGYSRIFEDSQSYWNNIRTILIAKMLSVFDFLSFKNFWINTLFFNFLVFFGCAALYQVFIQLFPKAVYPLIFCIFLLPSALFYSSMIHRDGLTFLSVSMIIYHLFFLMKTRKSWLRHLTIVALYLIVIFLLRNFVFLALIPALIAWIMAHKFPQRAFLSFLIIYIICIVAFFFSGSISPKLDFPKYVAEKQATFIGIGKEGNSTIEVQRLQPHVKSFIKNAPQAFNIALMRPYLTRITQLQFAPFALEILLIEILFILFVFFRRKRATVDPLIWFNIFFSLMMLIMTGYTVPIIGAIVRYRSIYFTFLLIPIVAYIDWDKLKKTLTISAAE